MIHLDKRLYSLSKVSKSVGTDQRVPVPDAKVDNGILVVKSLIPMLSKISSIAGQGSRIEGVYIEAASSFEKLNQAVVAQKTLNNNPKRKPYDLTTNSCIHFVKRLVDMAGKKTPWMLDPRPTSYIGEFRDDYTDLDYHPKQKKLVIEGLGEFSA